MAKPVEANASDKADQDGAEDEAGLEELRERKRRTLRAELAQRREALKRQEAERKLPLQFLYIVLNSIGAAVVLAMLAALVLSNLPGNSDYVTPDFSKFLLFMTFVLGFFATLLLLMRRLPPNWWQLANEFATTSKYTPPNEKWGGVLKEPASTYAPLFDTSRPIKKNEAPPTLAQDGDDSPFTTAPPPSEPPPDADPNAAAADAGTSVALFNGADAKAVDANAEAAIAEAKAQAIAEIERFVKATTEAIQAAGRTLDALTRFAMQLYLAGACSAVARKFVLSAKESIAMMVRALIQAGTGKLFAESFASNIEDYAQRDVYRQAITAGHDAMNVQLSGEGTPTKAMTGLLEVWTGDERKALAPRVVTFLFTDIVDAKALTQRLGNLHAQRVIKAHDEAVRESLDKHKGKQIQHTGDGVIATFPDPARALAAAQEIQQRVAEHNRRAPHLSANVRIALNAGEAVHDGAAFFGATVRMTAKICDKAKAGQILAADVIKAFCKSTPTPFSPLGKSPSRNWINRSLYSR